MNLAQQLDTSQFCGPTASTVQAADAYLRTRERGLAAGKALEIPSVASVFVSQRDKATDPMPSREMHGAPGLTMVEKIYHSHRALLEGERWQTRVALGARLPRVCGRPPRRRT